MAEAPHSQPGTATHVSANQWRTGLLKACVGAHVVRGVAEDIADACLALLTLDRDPLPAMLALLDDWKRPTTNTPPPQFKAIGDRQCCGSAIAVLAHGPSIIDLAQAGRTVDCEVDSGLLLLGLAQSRSHSQGVMFEILPEGGATWTDVATSISSNLSSVAPNCMSVRLKSTGERLKQDLTQLPQPSAEHWTRLQKLTEAILVPADSSNRADAGAGLTDND